MVFIEREVERVRYKIFWIYARYLNITTNIIIKIGELMMRVTKKRIAKTDKIIEFLKERDNG